MPLDRANGTNRVFKRAEGSGSRLLHDQSKRPRAGTRRRFKEVRLNMLTDKEIVTEPTDRKANTEASGFQMLPSCLLNSLTAGEITPSAIATYTAVVSFCNADRTGHPYRRTSAPLPII